MKVAKCYTVFGWWRYYRTEDGHTFSIRDGKDYFYDGNAITGERKIIHIKPDQLPELFAKISFEN